ncbi:MAG: response regulator transcription factor [Anaerolineae bacterium]|nr:response regulator transcription factor [Anaerolineae bacterium]MDQ7037041.1 response regulator transcription factor [Anaerolineae bacterium]
MMSKQQQILVVDDERTIREVVRRYLELEGYNVAEAETGTKALDMIRADNPDLIVLDIMLPGIDGLAITRKLRNPAEFTPMSVNGEIPIIFLTARTEEIDRITGFEVGGDDYIVKPFSPRELVARVKAVLRRSSISAGNTESPINFEHLQLDPRSRAVVVTNENVVLTAKEFDLLWFLARHPRQVFSRSQLLDNVWGYEFYGDESTVTVHVRRLREKIEPNPAKPTYIQTVWGIGYKFEAPEA